ncbi:Scr1 family TA system antitoxin-like transcriptional regulator [Glycomyces salinus]|uniref:Scr1 family TA system antitoxin-like transcriptional regulator n=1 Tax=Glycomyces salinus TaxID=980294 RepID=UPI0018EE0CD1|nr:Scr1 family TA system antitoxin-like transcriptional regulator [Glycomyces salinus]
MTGMPSNPRFDAWVIVNTLNRLYEKHDFPSLREGARFLVMHKDTLARALDGTTKQFDPSRVQGMAIRLGAPIGVAQQLFELAAQTHVTNASGFQESPGTSVPAKDSPFGLIELAAKRMDVYEEGLVNGLLQTREYMEELVRVHHDGAPRRPLNSVENKLERQQLAFEEGDPPEMRVILNEQSLLRIANSALYEPQIEHMLGLIERYGIGVYILPVAKGIHAAYMGSFTIMGFDHPEGFELAYVPSIAGASWVEDTSLIGQCRTLFKVTLRECIELGAYVNADKRVAEI